MKYIKVQIVLTTFLIVLFFCGCSHQGVLENDQGIKLNEKTSSGYIKKAQLTDREKQFLSLGNNNYFVFDYKLNDESKYNCIEVWIDRYEFGKKVSSHGKLSSSLSQDKSGLIIIAMSSELEKMKHEWIISAGNGTGRFKEEYITNENASYSSLWEYSDRIIKIYDDDILLAYIAFKDQKRDNSMNTFSEKFYNNPEENIKEIESCDLVYLLRCKFSENKFYQESNG